MMTSPAILAREPAGERTMLFLQAGRQVVAESIEEVALAFEIIGPSLAVDRNQLIDIGLGDFKPLASQARHPGYVTDGRLIRAAVALAALDDPTQHPQVFAEAGPEKAAAL